MCLLMAIAALVSCAMDSRLGHDPEPPGVPDVIVDGGSVEMFAGVRTDVVLSWHDTLAVTNVDVGGLAGRMIVDNHSIHATSATVTLRLHAAQPPG